MEKIGRGFQPRFSRNLARCRGAERRIGNNKDNLVQQVASSRGGLPRGTNPRGTIRPHPPLNNCPFSLSRGERNEESNMQKIPQTEDAQRTEMARDPYWDTLKFVLIVLVAYGHFFRLPMGKWTRALFTTIYMFHMPLFVFVSGRFSRIHDRSRYWSGIVRLLETFLVFHTVSALLAFVRGTPLVELLTKPIAPYWYLLALVYWRSGVALLTRKASNDASSARLKSFRSMRGALAGSICISLLAGFLPFSEELTVQRALAFLPFFVAGYLTADCDVVTFLRMIPTWTALAGLLSLFLSFLAFFPGTDLSFVTHCKFSYWLTATGDLALRWKVAFGKMGVRGLYLVGSTVAGLLVIRLVGASRILSKWGTATLVVYVYHKFFYDLAHDLERMSILPGNLAIWAAETVFTVALLTWAARFRWIRFALNPATRLFQCVRQSRRSPAA